MRLSTVFLVTIVLIAMVGIIRNKREVLEAPEPVEREVALEDQAQNLKSPNTQQSLLLQLALQ